MWWYPDKPMSADLLSDLTPDEWRTLHRLLAEISDNPAAVSSKEQEEFAGLFARSLAGKGDPVPS